MAKDKGPTGFLDYLEYGEITENFLHDLNNLSLKLYHRYQVGQIAGKSCSEEDFQGIVLESVLQKLKNFDPKAGNIGTYIYTIIRNESSNVKSKFKRVVNDDFDYTIYNPADDTYGIPSYSRAEPRNNDRHLRESIYNFAVKCAEHRIVVDQKAFYENIQAGILGTEQAQEAGFLGPMETVFLFMEGENHMKTFVNEDAKVRSAVALLRGAGLSEEQSLAVYMLIGESVFCLAHLLRGKVIKVPKRITVTDIPIADQQIPVTFTSMTIPCLIRDSYKFTPVTELEHGDVILYDSRAYEITTDLSVVDGVYRCMARPYTKES